MLHCGLLIRMTGWPGFLWFSTCQRDPRQAAMSRLWSLIEMIDNQWSSSSRTPTCWNCGGDHHVLFFISLPVHCGCLRLAFQISNDYLWCIAQYTAWFSVRDCRGHTHLLGIRWPPRYDPCSFTGVVYNEFPSKHVISVPQVRVFLWYGIPYAYPRETHGCTRTGHRTRDNQ